MADLEASLGRLLRKEGGYANNARDRGKETYCGISRRWHPENPIWAIIDRWKKHEDFPRCLERDPQLRELVREFYRDQYWTPLMGFALPSQIVADELLEQAVHRTVKEAVLNLQAVLNVLNRRGTRWPDLLEDGGLGGKTLGALRACCDLKLDRALVLGMNCLQGSHLISQMRTDEEQEEFAVGWLERTALERAA